MLEDRGFDPINVKKISGGEHVVRKCCNVCLAGG